jgi:hypothetical protein
MSGSMALRMPELSRASTKSPDHPSRTRTPTSEVQHVGYQSWTKDNLCVDSHHNDIRYYTSRWDALCPYIDVSHGNDGPGTTPLRGLCLAAR